MTSDDSRPAPSMTPKLAPEAMLGTTAFPLQGAPRRLSEMKRDFPASVYAAILQALETDLKSVAAGLTTQTGDALARQGHVLTALAGELGETELSARGRHIEESRDAGYAAETARLIAPLVALIARDGET